MASIRTADVSDMPGLFELAEQLLAESPAYDGIPMDGPKFKQMAASMMGSNKGLVLLVVDDNDKPQGFIIGYIEEYFFSNKRFATDICVFVREDFRHLSKALFKKFMAWASSKPRVVRIELGISSGADTDRRTGRFYETLGLELQGGIYTMRVG